MMRFIDQLYLSLVLQILDNININKQYRIVSSQQSIRITSFEREQEIYVYVFFIYNEHFQEFLNDAAMTLSAVHYNNSRKKRKEVQFVQMKQPNFNCRQSKGSSLQLTSRSSPRLHQAKITNSVDPNFSKCSLKMVPFSKQRSFLVRHQRLIQIVSCKLRFKIINKKRQEVAWENLYILICLRLPKPKT